MPFCLTKTALWGMLIFTTFCFGGKKLGRSIMRRSKYSISTFLEGKLRGGGVFSKLLLFSSCNLLSITKIKVLWYNDFFFQSWQFFFSSDSEKSKCQFPRSPLEMEISCAFTALARAALYSRIYWRSISSTNLCNKCLDSYRILAIFSVKWKPTFIPTTLGLNKCSQIVNNEDIKQANVTADCNLS